MCNLDRKLISLKKEIDFICNYLEIMKLRFPEKLDIQLSFDETLGKLKIPSDAAFSPWLRTASSTALSIEVSSFI